ncbi:hypothetical protein LMG28614_05687 [Paraburkholderia ultramafica]|uniref:Restriction endonuclease type IV Mrr domain-containing protein n=1 Tax=Paraburkholderia ultramafica TaxID=1544867 RepID=A0A6S7BL58_9BURK|nr:hypothetical protein [Paraburkholderia ultramafica]CAB3802745.1 hypothetical protein LMG28614_05687 [Paraburkholderia ultramafica]
MNNPAQKPTLKIKPSKVLYIKLGRGGSWEKECIERGILRFGYNETPFEAALAGDWETVRDVWRALREDPGAATRDVTQIRNFFEADESVLWVTFYGGLLWWCFAKPGVKQHDDGHGSYRETVDGWHCCDIRGEKLSTEKLSGHLLKVQAFRGTICDVIARDYLERKLNGEMLPEVEAAVRAENEMVQRIVPLMRLLTWQDFELLVDLVFANSGWRRIGQLGKTQKTVDFELMLPTTKERAFVQIKSSTGKGDLAAYTADFERHGTFDRMFFVWHSGTLAETDEQQEREIVCIGPERLARMVLDAGLTSWLREKVC